MSIVTKTGDQGETSLMYHRRVSKSDPRIDTCGSIDELNAALGLARASLEDPIRRQQILNIQEQLIVLMGEVATLPEDMGRFERDGFQRISSVQTAGLDKIVAEIESQKLTFKGWALPGDSIPSAALDLARTTCRRAERSVRHLQEDHLISNPEILVFLNRLSDALWLLARAVEKSLASSSDSGVSRAVAMKGMNNPA